MEPAKETEKQSPMRQVMKIKMVECPDQLYSPLSWRLENWPLDLAKEVIGDLDKSNFSGGVGQSLSKRGFEDFDSNEQGRVFETFCRRQSRTVEKYLEEKAEWYERVFRWGR